ncbi:SCO4225 family membrane protein [Streptomyces sp. NPDC002580]|uniref:SCO4225 family membrane protein n=1 Tax=Streptomyces sp. NPDC002580 TaxID=3364653 RepID=UPI003684D30A
MPNTSRPRRILELATGNQVARGYLAVVAASVLVMVLFPESAFAAGPFLLTAPLSFLGILLPFGPGTEGGGPAQVSATGFWIAWLLLCVFLNAAVLGALATRSAPAATEPAPRSPAPSAPEDTDAARPLGGRGRRLRTLLTPAVDNWLARGYLALVAAALAIFLCADYVLRDPGFAAIWPLITTAPFGILAFVVTIPTEYSALDWLNPLLFSAGTALAGLFNAVLIGRFAHAVRAREQHRTA